MEIKVKYLRDIRPIQIEPKGDWIDLRAGVDMDIMPLENVVIPLGIAVELPKGCTAIVAPRSSTYKKWGIIQSNSIGVIDESYCGDNDEWGMPVIAFRKTHIHKDDRICQFRIIKKGEPVDIKKVKILGNNDRGGFGSTGEK